MGYYKDTVKGVTWMGLLRGSTRAVGFLRIAILARLLTPSQFGLFGVSSLVLAFLEVLTETGINVFLVQSEEKLDEFINTAWIVSIVRGLVISVIMLFGAGSISSFFNSPDSYSILLLMSLIPFVRGFINPAIIKFQKDLAFNKEFFFRFTIYIFDALISVILAIITKSAISLVWGLFAGVVLEIILSFVFVKPIPKLTFEIAKIKKIVNRGKWMTFAGIFNYLFHQGDDWVVGKLLNTNALGIYQVAYKISTLPIYEVGEVIGKVTFPVYTRLKANRDRFFKAFIRITLSVSVLVIPFGILLILFTEPIILLILGDSWISAVPVVKVLAVFGIIRAICATSPAVYLAVNKQEYITTITLVSILGMGITILPLVFRYGIVGAAYSALIGTIVSLPFFVYYLIKIFRSK